MLRPKAPCIITSSMECHCLQFDEIPGTTKLFSTYLSDFNRVKEFYAHTPDEAGVRAAANEVHLAPKTRAAVAQVLREQNRLFGSTQETDANLDRLAGGAVAIVTGQQVGLFSGPAYSIYKALDAIRWAAKLTKAGVDAVPIFWMATEDHDLAEVNQANFGQREGVARIELPLPKDIVGASVGRIGLGPMAETAVAHAAELLEGPDAKTIADALQKSYGSNETFGSAFGKLSARLFKGRGLILLDPLDERFHELARAVYRQAVEDSQKLDEALMARSKLLDRRGFHAQVKVTPQGTLLFFDVNGKRVAVRRRNGDFVAGDMKLSPSEMVEKVDKQPESLTASVLLRPVLQDAILPTAAYIGGPAEVAYMAQAQVTYQRILGRMPAILPRTSFTLIPSEVKRTLERYGLDFREVLGGRQSLLRKMRLQHVPRGLAARFARDEKTLRRILVGYRKPLGKLDKTLIGALDTAERKMLHQFTKLQGKTGNAENLRTGILDRHERQILSSLYPHRGLQERSMCLLPFLASQGMELLDRLAKEMEKQCAGHRVVML
ncbi:MAG TPA: bacillithiol biosynthesis cysteine-adding enzyme BshC [Candidatus Acidoferrales bacterium]|nr:bacillithiol biosynthesis cysteine-adding enzyme BshC [Candidatus Acidoferrales bacterium]